MTDDVTPFENQLADAIQRSGIFTRYNDWTSDHVPGLPIEVCRAHNGNADETEIIARLPATVTEHEALAAAYRSNIIAQLRQARSQAIDDAIQVVDANYSRDPDSDDPFDYGNDRACDNIRQALEALKASGEKK